MWNPSSYLFNPHTRGAGRPLILKDKAMIYMLSALFCSFDQLGIRNIADESLSIYLAELLLCFLRSVFNLISQQSLEFHHSTATHMCQEWSSLPEMFVCFSGLFQKEPRGGWCERKRPCYFLKEKTCHQNFWIWTLLLLPPEQKEIKSCKY